MTQISFYHLTVSPLEKALPKLLHKAIHSGSRALVLGSQERLEFLNKTLWTATRAFLPHGMAEDGYSDQQPIYLTETEENPNHADMLFLVDGAIPEFHPLFSRCFDIFDGANDNEVSAARIRWKHYKKAGAELLYWKQTPKGAWEQVEG